jgi:ElaB/YqjD/DUF883 family membrane-anchored ribosome-binding protein
MKNELRKEAFYNDLETVLDDVELLLKDYGYDAEECMEDEDECEAQDEDMFRIISLYSQLRTAIQDSTR